MLEILRKSSTKMSGQFIDFECEYDDEGICVNPSYIIHNYKEEMFFEKCLDTLTSILDIFNYNKILYYHYTHDECPSIKDALTEDYNEIDSHNAKLSYVAQYFKISKEQKDLYKIKDKEDKTRYGIKILVEHYPQIKAYFHRILLALDFLEQNFEEKEQKNLAQQIPFQMSDSEIKLLFYYHFFSDEIRKKVKRYDLFERYKDLIPQKHIHSLNII